MNLALLLLGPGDLNQSRWWVNAMGALLVACGLALVIDASDKVTIISLEAFGWVMVAMGLAKIAFSVLTSGSGIPSYYGFQGFVYVVLGIAIADFPQHSGVAIPWLFGSAMILNGLFQGGSAWVIRYPNWGWFLASGVGHLVLGGLLFTQWRGAITWVVPLFLGGGLILLGLTTLRIGLRLGRDLRRSDLSSAEAAVLHYLDFHVAGRFRKRYLAADPVAPSEVGTGHGDLLVHVWTPSTVAKIKESHSIVGRYVMTHDSTGKYTVGHSAVQMDPDIYISHCDYGPPTVEMDGPGASGAIKLLRSKEVPGIFLPSFDEELKTYVKPYATFRFRNFSEGQLRTFWAMYRKVSDYNFTNRNCSVAVALALEAALMGRLGSKHRFRTLLGLLTNKDLWVAHFIRWKAREMVWTPGMMLDYANALQRVVEDDD